MPPKGQDSEGLLWFGTLQGQLSMKSIDILGSGLREETTKKKEKTENEWWTVKDGYVQHFRCGREVKSKV